MTPTTEELWKNYCDEQGCWYEDMPSVKESYNAAWNQASRIIKFLTSDNAGSSAKAICRQAISDEIIPNADHPHDAGDFNRCVICLEETGISIKIMDGVSDQWSRLVEHWDEIWECFYHEAGLRWSKKQSAPDTNDLIHMVLHRDQGE